MPKLHARNTAAIYVGVDPGAQGGIAVINLITGLVEACPMPATERDVWELIALAGENCDVPQRAMIEQVSGYMPGSGGNIGSAMFKFGQSYGSARMALIASAIPFESVVPSKWQKALGVMPRGEGEKKNQLKNRLKAMAQQLFPKVKVTLATADALLLAEYCRRKHEGKL